jgi:uncharacterized protein YprB with RNaseH-like and TPR domain
MRLEHSFIPVEGVGERTERELWRAGCTDWGAFDPAAVGEKTGERIDRFVDVATDRLDAGDARFFDEVLPSGGQWRLYEDFRDSTLFLDIETTGLHHDSNRVTTVSLHQDGETTTLVRGDDLSRDTLRAELAGADILCTYNGARFDVPFLETSFDLEITTPHLDTLYPCRRLDLTGGLKTVERRLGVERSMPDVDGREAVRLWHEHERGVDGALEKLIEYNRADTRNLQVVVDRVVERLHDATVPEDAPPLV